MAKKKSMSKAKAAGSKAATISKKARQAGVLKALESVATQGLVATKSGQRKASAADKASRLAMKGLTTRRAGHSLAQTGRKQARRDQRNSGR